MVAGCQLYVALPKNDINIPSGIPTINASKTTWFMLSSKKIVCIMRGYEDTAICSNPRYTSIYATDELREKRNTDPTNIFLDNNGIPSLDQFILNRDIVTVNICEAATTEWYKDAITSRISYEESDFIRTMLQLDYNNCDMRNLKLHSGIRDIRYPADEAVEWLVKHRYAIKVIDEKIIIYSIAEGIDVKYELKSPGKPGICNRRNILCQGSF